MNFTYRGLFLERIPRDKRGFTVLFVIISTKKKRTIQNQRFKYLATSAGLNNWAHLMSVYLRGPMNFLFFFFQKKTPDGEKFQQNKKTKNEAQTHYAIV